MLLQTEEQFLESTRVALGPAGRMALEFCDENLIDTWRLPWIEDGQELRKLGPIPDKVAYSIFEFDDGFGLIYSVTAFEPFGLVFHESDKGYKRLKKRMEDGKIKSAEVGCLAFAYLSNDDLSWLKDEIPEQAYLHDDVIRILSASDLPALWPLLSRHAMTENGTLVSYPAICATIQDATQLLGPFDRERITTLSFLDKQGRTFVCEVENRIESARQMIAHTLSECLHQFSDTYSSDSTQKRRFCSNNVDGELKDPFARKTHCLSIIRCETLVEKLSFIDFFWIMRLLDETSDTSVFNILADYRYQGFFGLNMFLNRCGHAQFGHLPRRVNFWFTIESGKHYPIDLLSTDESKTVRQDRTQLTSQRRVVASRHTAEIYKTPDFLIKDVLKECSNQQALAYLEELQETWGDTSLALPMVDVISQDLVNLFVGAEALYVSNLNCLKRISFPF